ASPIGHVNEIRLMDFGGGTGNGTSPVKQLFNLTPEALATTDAALKQTVGLSLVDLISLVRTGKPGETEGPVPAVRVSPPSAFSAPAAPEPPPADA
ncbi:MAG: hypothetical protein KC461_09715, partial [Dehalococcoidia bacterium]|nr:hypothetical protein [Dehalococcoidia bacterium]